MGQPTSTTFEQKGTPRHQRLIPTFSTHVALKLPSKQRQVKHPREHFCCLTSQKQDTAGSILAAQKVKSRLDIEHALIKQPKGGSSLGCHSLQTSLRGSKPFLPACLQIASRHLYVTPPVTVDQQTRIESSVASLVSYPAASVTSSFSEPTRIKWPVAALAACPSPFSK